MTALFPPSLVLPEPLRAAEIPSFTNYSVVVRLPDIARRTLAENIFPLKTVTRIQALIAEIPAGMIRQLDTPLAADNAQWTEWIRPYEGMNWLEVPWFFAEEYFYRRILEATGYFGSGEAAAKAEAGPWQGRDPYAHQKKLGLESTRGQIRDLAEHVDGAIHGAQETYLEALANLLLVDLWGNQNDLSMWPVQHDGAAQNHNGTARKALQAAQAHILTNDLAQVMTFFNGLTPAAAHIHILLDNAGYELVTDLALADFLITCGLAGHVTLHSKAYPVFVSDVIEKDVHATLDYLAFDEQRSAKEFGIRLRQSLVDRRLTLHQHPFWTSPQAAWEMPPELAAEIGTASLLIAKGDANYRRLLGDRHWEINLPFAEVVDYLPCAVLALRTLKSEISVGIAPERVPSDDPNWMIDGKWGLVEFAGPKK